MRCAGSGVAGWLSYHDMRCRRGGRACVTRVHVVAPTATTRRQPRPHSSSPRLVRGGRADVLRNDGRFRTERCGEGARECPAAGGADQPMRAALLGRMSGGGRPGVGCARRYGLNAARVAASGRADRALPGGLWVRVCSGVADGLVWCMGWARRRGVSVARVPATSRADLVRAAPAGAAFRRTGAAAVLVGADVRSGGGGRSGRVRGLRAAAWCERCQGSRDE